MANVLSYGWEDIAHLLDDRLISDVGVEIIIDHIRTSVAIHNQVINDLYGLFVEPTLEYKARYLSPVNASLEAIDPEIGRAQPIKVAGHYDVGWPLQAAGIAFADHKIAWLEMTAQEANRRTLTIMEADHRWMRNQILNALFRDSAFTYADPKYGDLTVQPLALANDGVTYFKTGNADAAEADQHLLAQAAAIDDDNNVFDTIAEELREHPENGGQIINFIPTGLKTAAMDLSQFHEAMDANIRYGVGQDVLTGSGPGVPFPGSLLGYEGVSRSWIVEWKVLPANYIISVCTETEKPLRMRQYPLSQFHGFYEDYERENAPFREVQYKRWCGFGGWNRVGAVVTLIGAADYTPPTGYGLDFLP